MAGFGKGVAAWVRVAFLVGSCFLLASTGWLSWLRCLVSLAGPERAQVLTLVLSYLMQAAGIAAYMALARGLAPAAQMRFVLASIAGYALLIAPATLATSLITSLAFGFLANILCGMMQGYYLSRIAAGVNSDRRGTAFGCAYGASTLGNWALSSLGAGALAQGLPCLAVCALLALACGAAAVLDARHGLDVPGGSSELKASWDRPHEEGRMSTRALLVLACATVAMASLVKEIGFGFPAEDRAGGIDLEFTRVFYGVGLVVAGLAFDRDRRVGMAFCMVSLSLPFLAMSLAGASAPATLLWSVEYALFGFFTLFRVTLLADFAAERSRFWLAGLGMLIGRVGDALGVAVGMWLETATLALVAVATLTFAVAITLLFLLAYQLYGIEREPVQPGDGGNRLAEFCVAYGLSMRERDVLPLLLDGRTNAEIAAELFVTERTVKYHVHNIMVKTGCANRREVANLYVMGGPAPSQAGAPPRRELR